MKLIEVTLTCGRCKKKEHLEFGADDYRHLSDYFSAYPEHEDRYRLYSLKAKMKGQRLIIFCPDCYKVVEVFEKGLGEDVKDKMWEFLGGE